MSLQDNMMMAAAWLAKATTDEKERAGYLQDAFQFYTAGGGRWDIPPCEPSVGSGGLAGNMGAAAAASSRIWWLLADVKPAAAHGESGRAEQGPGRAPAQPGQPPVSRCCSSCAHADLLCMLCLACRHFLGRVLP